MGARSEDDYRIELTDWGVRVVNCEGFTHTDDANFLRMENVMGLCHSLGKNKVLVDERQTVYSISRYSAYEAADKLLALGGMGFRIAVMIDPIYLKEENVQFLQTACNNRVVYLRFFDKEDHALDWLEIR